MGKSLQFDYVNGKMEGLQQKKKKTYGKIVEIVERSSSIFVGTLDEVAKNTFVIKTDPQSSRTDFFVEPEHLHGAVPLEKVTFRLIQWDDTRGNPPAEVLGRPGPGG